MSIIDSFDDKSEAIIKVEDVYNKSNIKIDVCIINFSYKIMDALIEHDLIELVDEDSIRSISCNYPLYIYKGTNIGIIKTTVGAPLTSGLIAEIAHVFSCDNFVLFGSCGGLDKNIENSKIIIPTHAYRDEGTSYHYVKPSDYIEIKNHDLVSSVLDKLEVPYVKGKTWTTDAFYRETRNNMAKRKNEGCIAVEMEVSACQAVADYYNLNFYAFLYREDNLDSVQWEKGMMSVFKLDKRMKHLFIALEIADYIIKK